VQKKNRENFSFQKKGKNFSPKILITKISLNSLYPDKFQILE